MRIPIIATSILKFGELWEKGIADLIREAGREALDNAGLKPSEVDSVYLSNVFASKIDNQSQLSSIVFEELGISNAVCINAGDASGAAAIKEAANSIISGESGTAMVLGVEKVTDFMASEIISLSSEFIAKQEAFAGASVQSQFAIITRKYLNEFKLDYKKLAFIPATNHKNAVKNEHAQYRYELSEEKINSSPMMSEPIRMLDCASYCDGAAALIMCNGEASKGFRNKVKGNLLASSLAADALALSERKSVIAFESTRKAADKAFKTAGIGRNEIDIMEVHDIVPISEVIAIEDLGFAKKGNGLKFIKDNIEKINCSGGLKACGHAIGATGVRQAIDVVNKLNGNKLKYGLAHSLGGTGGLAAVNIFSR